VVYDVRPEHHRIAWFAETAEDWRQAMVGLGRDLPDLRRRRAMGLAYAKRAGLQAGGVAERETFYRWLLEHREELEQQRRQRMGM
jgi:hypothetical protein